METLLSLTSKRAGEWFKEELRALGGVDHILSTICDCCTKIGDYVVEWSPTLLDLLRKVDRCMRVLENVSQIRFMCFLVRYAFNSIDSKTGYTTKRRESNISGQLEERTGRRYPRTIVPAVR